MKKIKGVNVCGHRPTSQGAVGSFVCLISFGVSARGCLDPLGGADGGGAHAQSRPAVTQGPAPADSLGTPAQDAICNANSPRLQHPTRPGSDSTWDLAGPALRPLPSPGLPLPHPQQSSERKFCNPGQTNAGLAQA